MQTRETMSADQILGNLAVLGIVLMCVGFLVWIYAKDLTALGEGKNNG